MAAVAIHGGGAGSRRDAAGFDPAARHDLVVTRRPGESKQGTTGAPIKLVANYFKFNRKTERVLLQYRVDLSISEDFTGNRKKIVRRIKDRLPPHLFDGT